MTFVQGLFVRIAAVTVLLLVTASACASSRPSRIDAAEPGSESIFSEGSDAFQKGQMDEAKDLLESYLGKNPNGKNAANASLILGKISLYDRDYIKAQDLFNHVQKKWPDTPAAPEANHMLAVTRAEMRKSQTKTAVEKLRKAHQDSPEEKKPQAATAVVEALEDIGAYNEAFADALNLWRNSNGPTRENAESKLLEIVDRLNFSELQRARREAETDEYPHGLVLLRIGRFQMHKGNISEAKAAYETMIQMWPEHSLVQKAREDLDRIRNQSTPKPLSIGVLLPLSGRYQAFGKQIKQAIDLAISQAKKSNPGLSITIADTAGDPATAVSELERLVLEAHAIAVIGPVLGDTAEAAAHSAEALGIPMISLSQRQGIPEIGPYVFRSGMTIDMQAKAVVDYTWDILGHRKYAVLYPTMPYGEELMHAYWNHVRRRGGTVVGAEHYTIGTTTFKWPIRRLVGRYQISMTASNSKHCSPPYELGCGAVRTYFKEDRCEKKPGLCIPEVDFDALLIPDSSKAAGIIAPAIPFEEVEIDTKKKSAYRRAERMRRRTGKDIKLIQLIGGSSWNSPHLVRFGGKWVEGSIFCDGFFPEDTENKLVAPFVESFNKTYERTPSTLDAYAYDAIGLLVAVMADTKPASRQALRDALTKYHEHSGVTGKMHFDSTGEMNNDLVVLTVMDEKIVPAPLSKDDLPEKKVDPKELYEPSEDDEGETVKNEG